jgi:hypothetical protein
MCFKRTLPTPKATIWNRFLARAMQAAWGLAAGLRTLFSTYISIVCRQRGRGREERAFQAMVQLLQWQRLEQAFYRRLVACALIPGYKM